MWTEYLKEREGFESLESQYGFATYQFTPQNEMYVRDLYVMPEFRRSGFATQIADALTSIALEKKCYVMIGTVSLGLPSTTDSVKALLFYGFNVRGYDPRLQQIIFIKQLLDKSNVVALRVEK